MLQRAAWSCRASDAASVDIIRPCFPSSRVPVEPISSMSLFSAPLQQSSCNAHNRPSQPTPLRALQLSEAWNQPVAIRSRSAKQPRRTADCAAESAHVTLEQPLGTRYLLHPPHSDAASPLELIETARQPAVARTRWRVGPETAPFRWGRGRDEGEHTVPQTAARRSGADGVFGTCVRWHSTGRWCGATGLVEVRWRRRCLLGRATWWRRGRSGR